MAKILVVEDEDFFRSALRQYLSARGHIVVEAPNGKVARDIIGSTELDLILSDVQMPFLDGVELLEWVKKSKPTPFILMTGFSNLLETKSAFDLGADGFLAKPFKNQELIEVIGSVLNKGATEEHEIENLDVQFCKVSIEEFVSRKQIDFDVYVRLSEKKYVKIGHAGSEIPTDRIAIYKNKGILFLHIRKEDFDKLVGFNLQVMNTLKGRSEVSSEKKAQFMKYTEEVLLERVFVAGVEEHAYSEAKDFLGSTVTVITENNESFQLISVLNEHSDFIYAHSLGVSLYSIMMARKLGYSSSQVFFKLGLAGLFHDVGKKEIPREILEKPRPLLTQKERALIETHPLRGREILLALKGMPSDVIQLVYEHHEDCIGQGYPNRLVKHQLHPLSKILITANLFVEHVVKGPHNPGMTPGDAIRHLESLYLDRLDKTALDALKQIFPQSFKQI